MSKLPKVPATILPLIQIPPLLKGESAQEYYELLGDLASEMQPDDLIEWLWMIQFLDCSWEIFRNRRFRALLVDAQRNRAMDVIITKTLPYDSGPSIEFDQHLARWKGNPEFFIKYDIDPRAVGAKAFVQVIASLDQIDKVMERLQRRADKIVEQLEYRREVFAHRARRAVDKVLTSQNTEDQAVAADHTAVETEPKTLSGTKEQIVDASEAPTIPNSETETERPSQEV